MSGGAFDYNHFWLEDWAKLVEPENPLLAEQMRDLCELLGSYDYYLSGDTEGEEIEKAWIKYRNKWIDAPVDHVGKKMEDIYLEIANRIVYGHR